MDDQQLNQLAESLESLVDDNSGKLRTVETKAPGLLFTTGDRAGMIQLAACCLRAAAAPITDDHSSRPVQLAESVDQGVMQDKSDRRIGFFQRVESFPDYSAFVEERKRRAKNTDTFFLFGCALILFVFLVPFVIGLTVISVTLMGVQ